MTSSLQSDTIGFNGVERDPIIGIRRIGCAIALLVCYPTTGLAVDITYLTNVPASASRLLTGQILKSQDQRNQTLVTMQNDCNVVASTSGSKGELWDSHTAGFGHGCWLQLHDDGSVVIHNDAGSTTALSGPVGRDGQKILELSGSVIGVFRGGPNDQLTLPLWEGLQPPFGYGGDMLANYWDVSTTTGAWSPPSQTSTLKMGEFLRDKDGINYAILQPEDCNFVIYADPVGQRVHPIWASSTAGKAKKCRLTVRPKNCVLAFEDDDNGTSTAVVVPVAGVASGNWRCAYHLTGNVLFATGMMLPKYGVNNLWSSKSGRLTVFPAKRK